MDGQRLRLDGIQCLRAIAAMMVVGAHLGGGTGFHSKIAGPTDFATSIEPIGASGVDLFFVISGFIMVLTTRDLLRGSRASARFIWKRIARIYPPYFVVTAAIFAVYLFDSSLVNSNQSAPPDVVASFLLLPQEGFPLLLVGWTLVFEMYFYLVFAICLSLPRNWFPWALATWGVLTLALSFLDAPGPWFELVSSPLNFEFLLGCVVASAITATRPHQARDRLALTVGAAGAVLLFVVTYTSGEAFFGGGWPRVLTLGVAYALIVYGIVRAEESGAKFPAPLVRLGDWSYSIYLVHVPVLKVASIAITFVGVSEVVAIAILPAVVGLVIVAGWAFYRLVERPTVTAASSLVKRPPRLAPVGR